MQYDHIAELILAHIDDPRHLFVFPSEVAGEFRQRDALLRSSKRAIRRDCFISWDRLKEREFSPGQERLPANSVFRLLFSAGLLEEHRSRGPVLQYLLGETPGEAAAGFQRQLALSLPQLQRAQEMLETHPDIVPPALSHDVRTLYQRYLEFLDGASLFEPAFVPPQAGQTHWVYHIFYPELIEDYREYRHLIDGNDNFVSHPSTASLEQATCLRFENARQELEHLTSSLHQLLERGAHPADIAVTLPDYDAWWPYLAEEAELRDIPLDFRSGRTLAEYPAGRLFSRLSALSVNGFGLEHLKRVVLEPGYPVKSSDQWRELIAFAVDHYYVRSWKGTGAAANELDRKLKQCGLKELRALYRNFRHQIAQLISAPDFQELSKRVHKFIRTFFESDSWEPEAEKVLQYCLLVLRELQEASESAGGIRVADPYSLWLNLLNQRIYVSALRKEAIPVYQYRVSAGCTPLYHFLPGAGQAETRIKHEELTFLREDYRAQLMEREPADMSGDFLSAYAQSGETVQFSCSDIGFSGPQLPPGELLSAGAVRAVVGTAVAGAEAAVDRGGGARRIDEDAAQDLFALEEAYWSGEQEFPHSLYPVQQRGFCFMGQTAFSAKGKDFSKTPVYDPKLLAHLFQVAKGDRGAEDGRFWFSPSSFDQYAGCPFMYLLNRGLKIEEAEFSSQWEDHRFTGIMLHRILTALYKRVQEKDGRWKRENQTEYLRMTEELCREEFDYQASRGRDFMYPIWKGLQKNTRRAVEVFVEQESKLYHGYELAEAEENLGAEIDENCGIQGRVDRISWKEGSAVIVDYKKGDPPGLSDVYQGDSLPPISQLPLYAYAAEEKGYHVTGAAYYSIKNGRYKHMLLDPVAPMDTGGSKIKTMVSPQEFHELKERIVAAVGAAAEHFSRGVFTTTASCDGCDFRTICRRKYNVRIPEVQQHGKP